METVGDLSVNLRANVSYWNQALATTTVATQAWVGKNMTALVMFANMWRTLGVVMFGVGAAGAFALTKMIGPAAEFQDQMAQVATMVDDTGKYMEGFAVGVSNLAVKFGEATASLTKGLYDILSATIDPAKALEVLEVSARAAAAGMTDTGTAADAVTTILNSYQLSADRAADVSDLLFAIVRRGKLTFADLAPAIGRVAASAALAGLPLEELGASIATITRAGIPTRIAVTSLNSAIKTFLTPTDDARAAAHRLGIELNTTTLRTKGLSGVLVELAGLQPELVGKIFPNVRALRAIAAALQGASGFAYDFQVMMNRAGIASEAYEKRVQTLTFSINRLKQAGLALVRAIAGQLLPFLKLWSDRLTALSIAFNQLDTSTKKTLSTIALLTPLILGLSGAFLLLLGPMAQGIMLITTKLLPVLTILTAFLMSPIGIVVALLATAAAMVAGHSIGQKFTKLLVNMKREMAELTKPAKEARKGLTDLGAGIEELISKYQSLIERSRGLGSDTEELASLKEEVLEITKKLGPEVTTLTLDYLDQKISLEKLNEAMDDHFALMRQRIEYERTSRKIEVMNRIIEEVRDSMIELAAVDVLKTGFWAGAREGLMWYIRALDIIGWRMVGQKSKYEDWYRMMEEDVKELLKTREEQIKAIEERIEKLKEEREEIAKKIAAEEEAERKKREFKRAMRAFHDELLEMFVSETDQQEQAVKAQYEVWKEHGIKRQEIEVMGVKVSVSLEEWKALKISEIRRESLQRQMEFEIRMVAKAKDYYIASLMTEYNELKKFGRLREDRRREIEETIFKYAQEKTEELIDLGVKHKVSEEEVLKTVEGYWGSLKDYITLTTVDWTDFVEQRLEEALKYFQKTLKKEEDLTEKWFDYLRLIGDRTLEDEIERIKKRLETEELTDKERIKLLTKVYNLEKNLIKKRKDLAEAVFEYRRSIGLRTLEDEIALLEKRLETEKLTQTERYQIMTEIVEKQKELNEKRRALADRWFEYERLIGSKTLEDAIVRLEERLMHEKLTQEERASLEIEVFNLEKDLAKERRALDDTRFKYQRLIGEKTLADEIARAKERLETEEMTAEEREKLRIEIYDLEKRLLDETRALEDQRFEYQVLIGEKTLEDEISRQAEIVRVLQSTGKSQEEIINAQIDLYNLLVNRERELIKLALERGETNAQIYARLVGLWKKYATELSMTATQTTQFIANQWKDLLEDFDLVGETMEERWNIVMNRMKARVETWFVSVHRSFESLGEIVGNFFEQWSEGLSEALVLWVKKTEDMEKVWQRMWQRLVAYALDQLLKLLAMAIVKFILKLLGLGGGGEVASVTASALKGGEIGKLSKGGMIGAIEQAVMQRIAQMQEGGGVLIRAHVGEFVIPKWLTDFIRRTESIPGELVSAIVSGRPPKRFQEGGLVTPGGESRVEFNITFMPGSRFTEADKASTRAFFETELWPLHEEMLRRS